MQWLFQSQKLILLEICLTPNHSAVLPFSNGGALKRWIARSSLCLWASHQAFAQKLHVRFWHDSSRQNKNSVKLKVIFEVTLNSPKMAGCHRESFCLGLWRRNTVVVWPVAAGPPCGSADWGGGTENRWLMVCFSCYVSFPLHFTEWIVSVSSFTLTLTTLFLWVEKIERSYGGIVCDGCMHVQVPMYMWACACRGWRIISGVIPQTLSCFLR